MISYLKLIRWPNLLIIVLTMLVVRYGIIYPFLKNYNFSFQLSDINFFYLVLSTVFIAAGGYAINDYFDVRIDLENRPNEVIVGTKISRRMAMTLHNIFSIIGIALGVLVSFRINQLSFSVVFVLISGALWFYSTKYKRKLLVGNIIIAILTALVPLVVMLYDVPLILDKYQFVLLTTPFVYKDIQYMMYAVILFSAFAFCTTMAREIIKDAQDYIGDTFYQRKSIPNTWGFPVTKWISASFLIITTATLWLIHYIFLQQDIISLVYIVLVLSIPLTILIIMVLKSKGSNDYKQASTILKFIMVAGLLYSVPFYIFITHALV